MENLLKVLFSMHIFKNVEKHGRQLDWSDPRPNFGLRLGIYYSLLAMEDRSELQSLNNFFLNLCWL